MNQHAWHKFLTEGTIVVAWTQLFCYVKSNSNCCGDRTSQKMAWNDSKHQQINTPQKLLFKFGDFTIGFLAEWWQQRFGDSSENFSSYRVGTVPFLRIHSSKNMIQKKVNDVRELCFDQVWDLWNQRFPKSPNSKPYKVLFLFFMNHVWYMWVLKEKGSNPVWSEVSA